MTDIVLRDIDPVLADRIRRIGEAHGWSPSGTLLRLLEYGLRAWEGDSTVLLAENEDGVLQAAIAAMEQVPSDPGFALIGRAAPLLETTEQPDQSISPPFDLE